MSSKFKPLHVHKVWLVFAILPLLTPILAQEAADSQTKVHVHTLKLSGLSDISRVDEIQFNFDSSEGDKDTTTVLVNLKPTANGLVKANGLFLGEEQVGECVNKLPTGACASLSIKKSDLVGKKASIKTTLDFSQVSKHITLDKSTIKSPERFLVEIPAIIYDCDHFDADSTHKMNIDAKSSQILPVNFPNEDPTAVKTSIESLLIEKSDFVVRFHVDVIDPLIEQSNCENEIFVYRILGSIKSVTTFGLRGLKNVPTEHASSVDIDEHMNQLNDKNNERRLTSYINSVLIQMPKGFEDAEFYDEVGYMYHKNVNSYYAAVLLRFPLIANWRTNLKVVFKAKLANILSANPKTGNNILQFSPAGPLLNVNPTYKGVYKVFVNLPEGAQLKSIKAPHAVQKITHTKQGVATDYTQVEIHVATYPYDLISIEYADTNDFAVKLATRILFYTAAAFCMFLFIQKFNFEIENSSESDAKRQLHLNIKKLKERVRSHLKTLDGFEEIVAKYKTSKNIAPISEEFVKFSKSSCDYIDQYIRPYVSIVNAPDSVLTGFETIDVCHTSHLAALKDFHDQKIDRVSYIEKSVTLQADIKATKESLLKACSQNFNC